MRVNYNESSKQIVFAAGTDESSAADNASLSSEEEKKVAK